MKYKGLYRIVKRTSLSGNETYVVQTKYAGRWKDGIEGSHLTLESAERSADGKYKWALNNLYHKDEVVLE